MIAPYPEVQLTYIHTRRSIWLLPLQKRPKGEQIPSLQLLGLFTHVKTSIYNVPVESPE